MVAVLLLLAYAVSPSMRQSALVPDIDLAQDQGFCSPGAWGGVKRPPKAPPGLKQWGSFCGQGDQDTGLAETSAFSAPQSFSMYLAGYLSQPGLSLEIEDLKKNSRLLILPAFVPADAWYRYDVRVPDTLRGDPVRLVARDNTTQFRGWLAFSEPVTSSGMAIGAAEAIQLLLRTPLYLLLTIVPGLAMGVLAIRRGMRDIVLVGVAMMAGIGAWGYIAFWLWFATHKLGHLLSFLFPLACIPFIFWNYLRLDLTCRKILTHLLVPLALCGAASLLVLSLGFLYGGFNEPFMTAGNRFSHPLPMDNTLPYINALALRMAVVPNVGAQWRSSDRPPLQTGLVLSQDAYLAKPRDLAYTIQGALFQSLWIFGAWLLLTAFKVDRRAIVLVLAVSLLSGFIFLNTFFVWPKLLAAAYTLGLLAIVVTPQYVFLQNCTAASILTGAILSLAMLSHGGSAFAIIGAGFVAVIFRRRVPVKALVLIAVSAIAIYTPWMLYQKLYDPPGDTLLKMHLAGIQGVDPRPFSQTLISAYAALTPRQIISNKVANLRRVFENSANFWSATRDLVLHIREHDRAASIVGMMRGWMFFFLIVNLGFLVIGPLTLSAGIWKKYRTTEWRAAAIMWVFVVLTVIVWCLLMFGPSTTIIHQGSYAVVLLAYAGSILAIWAFSRFLAVFIGCLQVMLNVLLYVVFIEPAAPKGLVATQPLVLGSLILCAVSLMFTGYLLATLWRGAITAPLAPRASGDPAANYGLTASIEVI